MKTKLEMAHDFAMNCKRPDLTLEGVVSLSWNYADAMQAEADKRECKEPRETHKNIAEFKMHHEYDASINYPPDAWVMYKGEKRLAVSIDTEKEWQPDWSQAPEWATHFFCERDEDDQLNGYFAEDKRGISIDFDIRGFDGYGRVCSCKTFNYQGNWSNSLRKRPK